MIIRLLCCASLLEISKTKMPLTHQPTSKDRRRHSICLSDVKLYSEAHLICQAGFLAYGYRRPSSPSRMCDWVCNGIFENRLSEYSDRIVQDSHLIPFSYSAA